MKIKYMATSADETEYIKTYCRKDDDNTNIFHCETGPAIIWKRSKGREWWLDGTRYLEDAWKKEMRRRKLKELGI